jgi:hypothetical protein
MVNEKLSEAGISPERERKPSSNVPLDAVPKSRWERSWPTIACGADLFSDGYLNGVWRTILSIIIRSLAYTGRR